MGTDHDWEKTIKSEGVEGGRRDAMWGRKEAEVNANLDFLSNADRAARPAEGPQQPPQCPLLPHFDAKGEYSVK